MATLADDLLNRPTQAPALITEAEYFAMCDAGVFGDDHVELNRGVLERMAPSGSNHGKAFARATLRIASAYEDSGWDALLDTYVRLASGLIRAPDLTVARTLEGRGAVLAADVLIAVEIADATRKFDLGTKAADYARAGIPHYWVVDLVERVTHVHATAGQDGYRSVELVPFDQPLTLPEVDRSIVLG